MHKQQLREITIRRSTWVRLCSDPLFVSLSALIRGKKQVCRNNGRKPVQAEFWISTSYMSTACSFRSHLPVLFHTLTQFTAPVAGTVAISLFSPEGGAACYRTGNGRVGQRPAAFSFPLVEALAVSSLIRCRHFPCYFLLRPTLFLRWKRENASPECNIASLHDGENILHVWDSLKSFPASSPVVVTIFCIIQINSV